MSINNDDEEIYGYNEDDISIESILNFANITYFVGGESDVSVNADDAQVLRTVDDSLPLGAVRTPYHDINERKRFKLKITDKKYWITLMNTLNH